MGNKAPNEKARQPRRPLASLFEEIAPRGSVTHRSLKTRRQIARQHSQTVCSEVSLTADQSVSLPIIEQLIEHGLPTRSVKTLWEDFDWAKSQEIFERTKIRQSALVTTTEHFLDFSAYDHPSSFGVLILPRYYGHDANDDHVVLAIKHFQEKFAPQMLSPQGYVIHYRDSLFCQAYIPQPSEPTIAVKIYNERYIP